MYKFEIILSIIKELVYMVKGGGNRRRNRRDTKEYKGSSIEIAFAKFLDEYRIRYKREVEIPELSKCRYDFYLYDFDLLIELQGVQHYRPVEDFGGKEEFKRRKRLDKLKKDKAKDNEYNFMAINYKDVESTVYKLKVLRKLLTLCNKCIQRRNLRKFKYDNSL